MKTVSIKVCNEVEGEYARSVLTENGIRVVLLPYRESAIAAIGGETGMVEVLIGEADVQRASELLDGIISQPARLSMVEISKLVEGELYRGGGLGAIAAKLIARGWPEARARAYVADQARRLNIYLPPEDTPVINPSFYRRQILRGLTGLVLGAILTYVTYRYGSDTGGFYLIFLGPLLWGAYELANGLTGWFKGR